MKLIHFKLRQSPPPIPPTPLTPQNSARMSATSHLLRIADEGPENPTLRRPSLDGRRQDGHLLHRNGSSDQGGGGGRGDASSAAGDRGESLELRGCTRPRQLRVCSVQFMAIS